MIPTDRNGISLKTGARAIRAYITGRFVEERPAEREVIQKGSS